MAPTQVVSRTAALQRGMTTVADALNQMAGVSVRDYGGLGGMKTISVRNLGAAHTAVSYDEVPVSNCMAGQIDISRFSTDHIEEVRLHIGQADDLLTPAILSGYSGLLRLRSSRPAAVRRVQGLMSASSWQTYREALSLDLPLRVDSLGEVRQGLTLCGSHYSTAGDYPYTFVNGADRQRLRRRNSHVHGGQGEAEWLARWGRHTELDTKAYYYRTHNELPGGIIYYNTFSREASREENCLLQSRLTTEWGRWKGAAILKYSHAWTLHTDPLTLLEWQHEAYRQDEAYLQASVSYRASRSWIVAVAQDLQWAALNATRTDCPDPVRRSSYTALRARYENSRVTLQPALLYTAVRDTKSADHDLVTPALSATVQPWSGGPLRLRLLVRRAYRLPAFNDLYYPRIGNTNLRPERTDEATGGLTYRRGGLTVTADYYEQYVHDKIVAYPSTFTWKMVNFERARLHGLDLTAGYSCRLGKGLSLTANAGYMYQRAVDRTEVTRGSQLPYTPRHSGNGGLTLEHRWLTLGYTVQWMGERYSSRMNTKQYRLEPFADQSLTLSHTFRLRSSDWTLYATARNLADARYEVVQYYPMPGRQWSLGLRWLVGRR
jgi:outer membrane cobalamin receptor